MSAITQEYLGDLRVESTHTASQTKLITDAPTDNKGRGASFSPTDLCVAALGACVLTIMGIYAQEKGIDIKGAKTRINKHMETGIRRIQKIQLIIDMPQFEYSDKDKMALIHCAKTCPVFYSLSEHLIKEIQFNWAS